MFIKRQPNTGNIFAAAVEGLGESLGTALIVKTARSKAKTARSKANAGPGLEGCTPCAASAQTDAIQAAARRAIPARKKKW